ncbi:hypothetical protein GALMADRAFT_253371, partial [Galerina marginata CBS 339.88]
MDISCLIATTCVTGIIGLRAVIVGFVPRVIYSINWFKFGRNYSPDSNFHLRVNPG